MFSAIVATYLVGCGTTLRVFYPLKNDAAYPFDDYYYADMKRSDRALVVVGAFGDEALSDIQQTHFGLFLGEWVIPNSRWNFNEVFIIPVTVGKDFYIDTVKVAPNPKSTWRRGEGRYDFSHPKTIRIDRPGIYYYGKVVFNDAKAYFVNEPDSAVIDLAVKKHPRVFNGDLPKINF